MKDIGAYLVMLLAVAGLAWLLSSPSALRTLGGIIVYGAVGITGLLITAGSIVWLLSRRIAAERFGPKTLAGILHKANFRRVREL